MGTRCSRYSALVAKVENATLSDPEAFYSELDATLMALIEKYRVAEEPVAPLPDTEVSCVSTTPCGGSEDCTPSAPPLDVVIDKTANPHNVIECSSVEPRELCRVWLEAVVPNITFPVLIGGECTDAQMWLHLRSGVVLCRLANAVRPSAVPRINAVEAPFSHRENIAEFLRAAGELGVVDEDRFGVEDLYSGHSMKQVYICLMAFSNAARGVTDFTGPFVQKPRHTRPLASPRDPKRMALGRC